MKPKQLKLWPWVKRSYVLRAHAHDYGDGHARYWCKRCDFRQGWTPYKSWRAMRRGIPCPNCNKPKLKELDQ